MRWRNRQEGGSKALGKFERELILTGVNCQGVVGDKGGEKYTGIRTQRIRTKHRRQSGLHSSDLKTDRNKTIWGQ